MSVIYYLITFVAEIIQNQFISSPKSVSVMDIN